MTVAPVLQWGSPTGVSALLDGVHELIDRLLMAPVDLIGTEATGAEVLGEATRAISRLEAFRLRVIAEADRAQVGAASGLPSTGSWVAARTRVTGAAAAADVRLAKSVEALSATAQALADGTVSAEHAAVIANTRARLPDTVSDRDLERIESHLVDAATRMDADRLRRLARRALAIVERSAEEVDRHEGEQLQAEEQRAWERCRLTMHRRPDGTTSGTFVVPRLVGDILAKTVQQLASPRRMRAGLEPSLGAREAREQVNDLDWAQRYGQAFAELIEHLPTDRLHGKVAATVVVTLEHQRLVSALGAAGVDTGTDLSAADARRLACGAGLVPAVLDGASLPLDLGRAKRLFQEHQRVALATAYDTCAGEGCDRPFAWCELHHERPWAAGGRTDLADAVPLCGHHHRLIHNPRFEHTLRREKCRSGRIRKTVAFRRRP